MSTPAVVAFAGRNGKEQAAVYKHWDGHPDTMTALFEEFFAAVESQTLDTRYGDPTYLAAKFLVFLAAHYRKENGGELAFLSVGIVQPGANHGQCYDYTLICHGDGRPLVKQKEDTAA